MTTHEMVLLCSSLQSFVFGCGFCHLCSSWKIGLPPTYSFKHAAACCSTANFYWDRWCLIMGQGGPQGPGSFLLFLFC